MIRPLALVAALLSAAPALAQDRLPLALNYDPPILWFSPPLATSAAVGRVRIVTGGREGVAVLDVDQYYLYQQTYRRALAAFSQRMSVRQASPLASRAAFVAVLRAYPDQVRLRGVALKTIEAQIGAPRPDLIPGS